MSVAVNQLSLPQVDGLRARLGFWLRNDASRLLWPGRCLACRSPGIAGMDLCLACEQALPRMPAACLRRDGEMFGARSPCDAMRWFPRTWCWSTMS